MVWIGRTLLYLVTVLWCTWQSLATNPGLKVRLSQAGLNYAARIAVEKMSAEVQGAALPDQSGESHTPVGKVHYEVKNMKVGELTTKTLCLDCDGHRITMGGSRNRGVQKHPRRRIMRHGNPRRGRGAKIRMLGGQNLVDV